MILLMKMMFLALTTMTVVPLSLTLKWTFTVILPVLTENVKMTLLV